MQSVVYDFVESSIWDKHDRVRTKRVQAVFELITFVKVDGKRIRREVRVDYGVFFDPEDELIKAVLSYFVPEIAWGEMVYHRAMDNSRIFITPWDDAREIAELRLRGIGSKRRLSGEELREMGVIPLHEW